MVKQQQNQDLGLYNTSQRYWKDSLDPGLNPVWRDEINAYETELYLKKQGKIEDKVFGESRLRRGSYGQRYDNGKRHDGKENKQIPFPDKGMTKGLNTEWHAPGMSRIKIPYGGMTFDQMLAIADLSEEYSDAICHVTTRQDIQLHYVHIEDTPTLFRRLAAVGITTREACGNSVRNITACPISGVCNDESFDVTPYADAMFNYLLGHPDVQDFGRKFKIAFSGCKEHPCGLTSLHDLGLIAKVRDVGGKKQFGFEYYVGGGLGAVPFQAKLFDEFVPVEEMLPLTQAVCRIFARYGEKKNRNRARMKFLVADWGIDKFREEVLKERATLKSDPRWKEFIAAIPEYTEKPLKKKEKTPEKLHDPDFERWLTHNVRPQKQPGYSIVTVALPLGDITANQMRDLVVTCKKYIQNTVRTTVEQNLVLRWVRNEDLSALYHDLKKTDLADANAGTIIDVTACPGTDTCKLGISSSRGLAGELRRRLADRDYTMDEAIRNFRIKVSGCFNSCGQHHIADIGFYGVSRKVGNYLVPHFQVVLGGQMQNNAGSYGLATVSIPSKAIPETLDRLTGMYLAEKQPKENFQNFVKRLGKVEIKKRLLDLTEVPAYEANPAYYTDWANVRTYTTSDIGKGECAGEVVSLVDMGLKEADRIVFEAQVKFDAGETGEAARLAYQSMLKAAQGLIKGENPDISENAEEILQEFDKRFCETKKFHDPFAGAKFARYLFAANERGCDGLRTDQVRQRIEEAQLFIEAAYSCNVRMSMQA